MIKLLDRYYDLNHSIYHLIILAALIAGFVRYKKLSFSSRIFLLLLSVTPFVELVAYYYAIHIRNSSFIYNPFTILQFALISLVFYRETGYRSVAFIFAGLLLFISVNAFWKQTFFTRFDENVFLLECLFTIILFFMFLIKYFQKTDSGSLAQYPVFWIGAGLMLFSICAIVSFGFTSLVVKGSFWHQFSVWARKISNYLLYLSFLIGFLSPQKTLHDTVAGK